MQRKALTPASMAAIAARAPVDAGPAQLDPFATHLLGSQGQGPGAPRAIQGGAVPPVQRKASGSTAEATPAATGSGHPLPAQLRAKMERAFGADFAAVRIHEGAQAPSLGGVAYAQGTDIHFAPGKYQPDSQQGQELLGHELTHVVQQSQGRVQATTQAKGTAINDDDALEREADDRGTRAARGERVGDGRATIVAGASRGSVQRYAFVAGKQVTKAAGLAPESQTFVTDTVVRAYDSDSEFGKHAAKTTDYLGNLKDGTWVRFNPTGINLLGENHTRVTAEETVPAVNSKSFIYEPFSADDLSSSPAMNAAYQKENADRFKTFGVDGVADKRQFGAESLYPKIGYGMVLALPFFNGAQPLDDLKSGPGKYTGQPVQRYLKIAWGMTADAEAEVTAKRKAKTKVEPKFATMADTHTAVKASLDAFITALPLDGYLGDELTKPGKAALLPSLARYAKAVSNAMIEMAANDPSSRLDPAKRAELKKKGAKDEAEKEAIFDEWRDFKFEDMVADATARGVRYAGMGQEHLKHLIAKGLTADQHPFKMADVDLARFRADTAALQGKAVPGFSDPATMKTGELIKNYAAAADAGQKADLEAEMRKRWINVTVFVKKAQEGTDDVYVQATHGGRQFKSPETKMKSGAKQTFRVPLDALAPVNGTITVKVYDWDALSADDLISIIDFRDPFTPQSDNRPWDDAEYETTVEFDR